MIFSEEFDIALSLIIDNDMRNRENIINLIKSIPLELISKINKILKDRANDSETIELEQSVKGESSTSVFVVKITLQSLSICVFKWSYSTCGYGTPIIRNPEEYELNLDITSIDTITNAVTPFYIGSYCYSDLAFIFPGELVLYKGYRNKEKKLVVQIDDTCEEYEREINIDIISTNAKKINRILGVQNIEKQNGPVLIKRQCPSKQ